MHATHCVSAALLITACISDIAHATDVAVCTDHGRFVIELADAQAPKHVENFLRYVDMAYYSGTVFHRAIQGYVVQAGGLDRKLRTRPTLPPIENESRNRLSNLRTSVAAARESDPASATSQFFVNIEDNTKLDASKELGYTVFGRIKEGIQVLDRISRLPTGRADPLPRDVPAPLPVILSIARLDASGLDNLPAENRGAAIKEHIAAAAAAEDHALTLRWVEQYRATCDGSEPQIALIEARAALASDLRPRAVFVLQEYFARTPASDPSYAEATALYRSIVPEARPGSEFAAECTTPPTPVVPDGMQASTEDMVAAQTKVHSFVADGQAYLACLTKIIEGRKRTAEQRSAATEEHNRWVGVMEQAADEFNEQLRLFKTKSD